MILIHFVLFYSIPVNILDFQTMAVCHCTAYTIRSYVFVTLKKSAVVLMLELAVFGVISWCGCWCWCRLTKNADLTPPVRTRLGHILLTLLLLTIIFEAENCILL